MVRKLFLIIQIALLFYGITYSQQLLPQPVIPGQWIKSWMLCGPIPLQIPRDASDSWKHLVGFNTDYLLKSGGEQDLKVKTGDAVRYLKGSAKWILFNSPDSIIDLDEALSKDDPVLAYAYSEVQAEETRIWFISLGTNDGGRLWVNGKNVWDYQQPRGLFTDDDLIPVLLNKGNNTLLLKIEERGNRWGFCIRFLPFSINTPDVRDGLLTITTGLDGEAMIVSKFATPVLQQLIQNLDIEIVNHQKQPVLSEQRTTDFTGKINLKPDDYKSYYASINIHLKSGEKIQREISFFAGKLINYTLFSDRKSDYRIALSSQASESERWAALELQHWIKVMSGTELPVQDLEQPYMGHQIIVGYNDFVREKTGGAAPADLDESFRYCNSGPDILIYGGKMRGTMYGVMSFLENEFGCRWYTPSVNIIPQKKDFYFKWLDHSEEPGVRVRNDFYFEAFDPVWAARNKVNGAMGFRQQPGGVESYWAVHTFYPLMPPEEFYDKHPEYYSLIDGKRISPTGTIMPYESRCAANNYRKDQKPYTRKSGISYL